MPPEAIDWDAAFDGADWFHWTGITAALGETARRSLAAALTAAKASGATVSCDLNYRKKLWTVRGGARGHAAADGARGRVHRQ